MHKNEFEYQTKTMLFKAGPVAPAPTPFHSLSLSFSHPPLTHSQHKIK